MSIMKHAGYVVTLAEDIHEEDAQHILDAIRMIRGVLSAEPINASFDIHIGTERARSDIRSKLIDLARSI